MQAALLHRMRLQAAALAAEDSEAVAAVRRRVVKLEQALEEAQGEEVLATEKMHASSRLVSALDEQLGLPGTDSDLKELNAAPHATHGAPQHGRVTVAQAICALLEEREEATTQDILDHVQRVRPDSKKTSAALTRLVQRGVLVRPRPGLYRLNGEWVIPESR